MAKRYEIYPSDANEHCDEEFEILANSLQPGDELVLHDGIYTQSCDRSIRIRGTRARPITIRAAHGATPTLTRPYANLDTHNNLEIVDSAFVTLRGLRFFGGSIGVRFIGGHDLVFERNEVSATGASAITLNSGDSARITVRDSHIHHTGRSALARTTGEGIYVGCNDAACKVSDSVFEANRIHDLYASADGGNDGIEIKPGSGGNLVIGNIIYNTTHGRAFPCIFVYGGAAQRNVVEYNQVFGCGEAIQVVADATVRYNSIADSSIAGIVSAPHRQIGEPRNVTIVDNTVRGHPTCLQLRWRRATNMVLENNTLLCPDTVAIDARGLDGAVVNGNIYVGRSNARHDGLLQGR